MNKSAYLFNPLKKTGFKTCFFYSAIETIAVW